MSAAPVLLLLLLCFPLSLPAQQPLHFAPAFRNYTTDNGLPNNWVYDIYQDKTGYIWIATDHGVCRFNGYAFEQFPDTLYTNLTSVMTGAMAEDALGRLWYVDFQSRVFYIENGKIHPYPYNHVIEEQKGRTDFFHGLMVEGAGEELWLVSRAQGGVLHLWGAGQYEHILPPAKAHIQVFEKGDKSQYCLLWNGRLESALESIIAFQSDSGVKMLTLPYTKENTGNYCFKRLSNGDWCLAVQGYLYLWQKGKLVRKRQLEKNLLSILEEPDGALLAGYGQGGLARYRSLDDFLADKKESHFFPGRTVSRIMRDREGGYWIGTQQEGIFYCPAWNGGNTVKTPLTAGQSVKALAADGEDRLFVGLEGGRIFELDREHLQLKEITPPGIHNLNGLHYDPLRRTLAAAASPSGFYRNGRWQTIDIYSDVYGRVVQLSSMNLRPATGNQDWVSASMGGLSKVSLEKKLVVDRANDILTSVRYYSALEAPDGRVWASRIDGLFEWKGGKALLPPNVAHPAFRQICRDMELLGDGSLVLCPKGHGVVIWKPGDTEVTEIGQKHGLPSNKVHALHVAANDVIWACTHNGLSRLTPLGGRRYRVDNFTVKHGLPSNTVNDVLTLGADIWVATAKGLFCMREKPDAAPMPAPLFARILVHNVPYPIASRQTFPRDSANFVIEYLALHFRSGGDTPYRFRLLKPGGDTLWTATRQRQVYFSNLSPAGYRFEVQAQDEEGRWSPVSAFAFTIRPAWYATWWALSLFVSGLGLGVYRLYRYRIGQIKKESRLAAEMFRLERSALQAQMNPHFIFNCLNSIQHFILNNESEAAVLYLAKFAKLVRGALNASVAGQVSLEEEVKILDNYLALEQLRFKNVFEYSISADEKLDRQGTLLPPLIVQPFVENAVLHGMKGKDRGGQIEVSFRQADGFLQIRVCDNGPGLHRQSASGDKTSLGGSITGRRLELMQWKKLHHAIGVEYLVPETGTGTLVLIRLPL